MAALMLCLGLFLDVHGAQRNQALQRAAERSLAERRGTVVVVDVTSGKILAARGLETARKKKTSPGSTLKPFVLMALLDAGKVDVAESRICRKPLRIGGANLDCTHPEQVAELNAAEALAYSCNSYFAEVAPRLTGRELAEALRRAGLDTRSGMAEGEAEGRIAVPATQEDVQLEALGYSGVEVTPLELLEAYRRLALRKRNGAEARDAAVFAGLEKSVEYGMARSAAVNGMKVAGKTGTSPARNTRWTHGFFAGYAPADFPEIAVVVYLEQGRGMDAAAVAQPVLEAFSARRSKR
jgi:cell division protein FtsI/penicillin-binding protein 2